MKASARRQMALMGSCYALGAFADNFYKQAAVLMAAALAMTGIQSWATVLFSLPFVLFSAWAGWLADRLPKKQVIVAAKALELCAMLAGAWMLYTVNWAGILAVMFLMASQSTMFSPAINGSIPELFHKQDVPRVNAAIKAFSTVAILAGMALAGLFLDLRSQTDGVLETAANSASSVFGRAAAGIFLLAISTLGLGLSFFLQKSRVQPGKTAPFPLAGPLCSLNHAKESRKDPALFLVLCADCWFYAIAVIAVISIANLSFALGYGNTLSGMLAAVLMTGVAAGSLFAGRHSPESWQTLLLPACLGMALTLALCALSPLLPDAGYLQPVWLGLCLFACGLCGGMYLIPLESAIQVLPAPEEKGKIIALSNCMSFSAMVLAGAAFAFIGLLPPALTFLVYAAATLAFALRYIAPRLRALPGASLVTAAATPLGLVTRAILRLRYRIDLRGFADISAHNGHSGTLYVANHPSLLDPLICWCCLAGIAPRPLADTVQMAGPVQRLAGKISRVITIPDIARDGKSSAAKVRLALEECAAALRRGENVLLFPAGRASRDGKERLGANSAVFRLLREAPGSRLVALRLAGLWGSSFSYAFGNTPRFMRSLLKGLITIAGNGLFFSPRRALRLEAQLVPAQPEQSKADINSLLEAYFAKAEKKAVSVPRFFWQKKRCAAPYT